MKRLALAIVALASCRSGATRTPAPGAPPPPRPGDQILLQRLSGGWRWLHGTIVEDTYRLERERWHFDPITTDATTGAAVVRGRYRRDVVVVALDGKSFLCNQQTAYVQTAVYDVRVIVEDHELVLDELEYRTQPSPCEPGFRHRTHYNGRFQRHHLALDWDGGTQTLSPLAEDAFTTADLELPALPASPAERFSGAWHWSMRGRDKHNDIRDEDEAWDIAVSSDGTAGGTYVRTVTIHSGDGSNFPCAGTPSYTFTDRYTLRGSLAPDATLSLDEIAVDAGTHPCLSATPDRHLDTMTAVTVGAHVVATWRGKRKQVLHRE